jgi:hypothetical protein
MYVLLGNFPGGTEEINENFIRDSRSLGSDMKLEAPKYISYKLPTGPRSSVQIAAGNMRLQCEIKG